MTENDPLSQELLALESLSDREIDTSDIPVRSDFSDGVRGRFYHITSRDYDVRAIANWCISRAKSQSVSVSNLWLNKIVYFIYEEALKIHNVLLTPAKAEAWDHGPVFREIYFGFEDGVEIDLLKSFDFVSKSKVVANENFALSDLAIFESVWNSKSHLTPSQLRKLSHGRNEPWHRVWHYAGKSNPGMHIDIATIIGAPDRKRRRDD